MNSKPVVAVPEAAPGWPIGITGSGGNGLQLPIGRRPSGCVGREMHHDRPVRHLPIRYGAAGRRFRRNQRRLFHRGLPSISTVPRYQAGLVTTLLEHFRAIETDLDFETPAWP